MGSKQYVGIDLLWDYEKRTLKCSMDEYIETALQELQHATPRQHFKGPSKAIQPQCGATIQYIEDDTSSAVSPE